MPRSLWGAAPTLDQLEQIPPSLAPAQGPHEWWSPPAICSLELHHQPFMQHHAALSILPKKDPECLSTHKGNGWMNHVTHESRSAPSSPQQIWASLHTHVPWLLLEFFGSLLFALFFKMYLAALGLGCGMQHLVPWSWIEPGPLHWEFRVLVTAPPGRPLHSTLTHKS